MTLNVVLGGGGSALDEERVLARFASMTGTHGRVLYVPWAHPEPTRPELADWAGSVLSEHGISRVDVASAIQRQPLEAYDAVFVGGGNTYLLLHRLRSTRMHEELERAIRDGLPCYGGSAGAIVLGAHIGTCAHLDPNDIGLIDLTGLDVLGGRAVWVHYQPGDRERMRAFAAETGCDLLVAAEDAGLAFDGTTIESIGPGHSEIFPAASAE
jgi:dipeptidase E